MFEILTTWDHREMRQDCRLSALFSDGMSQTDPMWSSVRWPLGQLCALVIEAFSPDSWSLQFSSARSTLSPRESASDKKCLCSGFFQLRYFSVHCCFWFDTSFTFSIRFACIFFFVPPWIIVKIYRFWLSALSDVYMLCCWLVVLFELLMRKNCVHMALKKSLFCSRVT